MHLSKFGSPVVNKLKPTKNRGVSFTSKLPEQLPNITFDGIPINDVTEHKDLGLTLSNNGQWHSHIDNIISSAPKYLGIMHNHKLTFSRDVLNQIFLSYYSIYI